MIQNLVMLPHPHLNHQVQMLEILLHYHLHHRQNTLQKSQILNLLDHYLQI
jgi:hypothetical protein